MITSMMIAKGTQQATAQQIPMRLTAIIAYEIFSIRCKINGVSHLNYGGDKESREGDQSE